jgi:hypothetical protein
VRHAAGQVVERAAPRALLRLQRRVRPFDDQVAQLPDAMEEDLKQFLVNRSDQRALCEMTDAGLDFDIDRPEDYERALAGGDIGRAPRPANSRG